MNTTVLFEKSEELDFAGSVWRTADGGFVTSSLKVAEYFEKEHRHVLDAIREKLGAENSAAKSWFFESTYDNRGKQYPMYLMNQSGFTFLVMGFTGAKADQIKIGYINEFERMRATIQNQLHDFTNPEYIRGALVAINTLMAQNKQLKIEIKENAPFTEIGKIVSEKSGGTTMSDVAKEIGIKGITRDYILAVLVEEGVAKNTATGYIKVYDKHTKDFVDARLYQREKPTGVGFKTYLKATTFGKGWLINLVKRYFAKGFKIEKRGRKKSEEDRPLPF